MDNLHGILSGKFAWKICLENLFGIFKNGIYLQTRPADQKKLIFKNKEKYFLAYNT